MTVRLSVSAFEYPGIVFCCDVAARKWQGTEILEWKPLWIWVHACGGLISAVTWLRRRAFISLLFGRDASRFLRVRV